MTATQPLTRPQPAAGPTGITDPTGTDTPAHRDDPASLGRLALEWHAVEDARVLVADDDSATRRAAIALLERAGFWRVDYAVDGRTALAAMRRRTPAVLLLDVHMPDLDGIETLRALAHELPARSATSVLAISGDASPDVRKSMLVHGADDFLVRPCPGAELVDHVRSLVQRTQSMNRALRQMSLLDGLVR